MRVAAEVAEHKRRHPELFCPVPRCLWRTGDGTLCPRHVPLSRVECDLQLAEHRRAFGESERDAAVRDTSAVLERQSLK